MGSNLRNRMKASGLGPAAFHLATYESRHFTFEGVGSTEGAALDVLKQGLRAHGVRAGLESDWWWMEFYASEAEADSDGGLWSIRRMEIGAAYMDGSEIKEGN